MGDRQKLSAAFDPLLAEAIVKKPADGGHEGRATRQEDPVDFGRRSRSRDKHLVEGGFDTGEVGRDPGLEILAPDTAPRALAKRGEEEFGFVFLRQSYLGCRDRLIKRVAFVMIDQIDECLQLLRLEARTDELLQFRKVFECLEDRQLVPAAEIGVVARRDFKQLVKALEQTPLSDEWGR